MRSGVRFFPSNVALSPYIHWGLLRAFGPPERPFLRSLPDPDEALRVVRRMGMEMRLFTRCPREILATELPSPVLAQGLREVQSIAARGLALEQTLQLVDRQAASLRIPFLLIKGSAVARTVARALSLRGACDVDILCEPSDAVRLHSAMKDHGYAEKTPTHPSYHLPMLVNATGGALEIHTAIPYLSSLPNSREVTFQQLIDAGLVKTAQGMSTYSHVPSPEFLLAHCVAHGIAQHGYIPHSYPLLRMLADAVDLGVTRERGHSERVLSLVSAGVSADEYAAVRNVALALLRGDVETVWTDQGPTGRMLRHMTIGALDEDYVNGLKLFHAAHVIRTFGLGAFFRDYGQATFGLANEDVTRIYGQRAQGQELKYKLARPLDVTARILRMVPDASRVALRRLRRRN